MQCSRFAIDRKPWCVWDWNLNELTTTFLDTFDATYFDYLVTIHEGQLDGDDARRAGSAIRTTYCHALETLFALLGAAVQAPDCVPGWIQKYRSQELDQVVEKITNGCDVYSKIWCDRLTWAVLVQLTMKYVSLDDKDKERRIKSGFEMLWTRLSHEFLSERNRAEYNSIKHGFRIGSGGSVIAVGVEETPGVPCRSEEMKVVGASEHGSSFYEPTDLAKRNIRLIRRSLNWDPAYLACRIRLIAMSLRNIISFLKITHGAAPESVQFCWPQELDAFHEVWKGPSLLDSSFSTTIRAEDIDPKTADEILTVYDQTK